MKRSSFYHCSGHRRLPSYDRGFTLRLSARCEAAASTSPDKGINHHLLSASSLAHLPGNLSPQNENLGRSSISFCYRINMAGLFKRVYDWLLRLFWLVSALSETMLRAQLQTPAVDSSCCKRAVMLTRCSGWQGDGDGHHDDRPPKCWQNLAVAGSGGKKSPPHSANPLSRLR